MRVTALSHQSRPLSARKTSGHSPPTSSKHSISPEGGVAQGIQAAAHPGTGLIKQSQSWMSFSTTQQPLPNDVLQDESFFLDDSLFNFGDTLTPNFGPVEWYDLLAEDAISSMQGQAQSSRWNFDITSLSRRQSPRHSVVDCTDLVDENVSSSRKEDAVPKPWNTDAKIELDHNEVVYFEHFLHVVAPILDLFDPGRHFANVVPHLALRNAGLLKSLLAVGACHMATLNPQQNHEIIQPLSPDTPASTTSAQPSIGRVAEQYYYETLQYLSQNLLYQGYTISQEILATAIMIST